MNTKRQTVWLVSMLSLMVVLSAYYLFTEDVNEGDLASTTNTSLASGEIIIDEIEADDLSSEHIDMEQEEATHQTAQEPVEDNAGDDVVASEEATANILEQLEQQQSSLSTEDYFATMQMERNEQFDQRQEELMEIITSAASTEEVTNAHNELLALEEQEAKITDIENQLMEQYEHVLISQDENKWQVTVKADQLQRSEGVSITDLLQKELNVEPSQIVIQMVR